ncbi:MAG: DNA topoisomerase, partial [Ruminococcus flavefaciens]|nr:DNA topoisomerase [Ruminococcus flavefaciens]
MRIIPKKVKVKNTVWKCYSMADIIVALIVFGIIFICVTMGQWIVAAILGLIAIGMFIPTPDGIFYTCVFENVRFLFSKKKYTKDAKNAKENIDALVDLKEIKDSGLIAYRGGMYGRVIKVGQKNFGIEDAVQQNIDINYFANALKQLDQNQSADIVKIDRPVTLDGFASELFARLSAVKDSDEGNEIKAVKENVLHERIDRIDRLNNISKQYLSDYYIIIYGRNELDLESTAVNVASEITKCGLSTQLLGMRDTAVFLKYSFSRNFDEREIKDLKDEELLDWVKPKEITFRANKYTVDGTEAAILAVSDYPLRVKNAWGAELFNIPNTKVVMHIKPVDKMKAIHRIDKVIGEMETKQIISDKASEANSAETHRQTMDNLLNALQTENESLFDVTLTVTAYNYTGNENYKKNARRAMLSGNFRPSTLYGLQIEAFKSAEVSPVSTLKSQERGINSSSLAAAFPFVRTFVMDEGGILLGENNKGGFPFIFNMWKRGNLYQNSNAFIIGKSGSGKSYFLKNLILNEWANGTRVVVLDPEAEYLALTRNLYGNVINVGNAREGRINPFHIYKILTEDGTPADSKVTFNTHLKMLESFFKIVLADAPLDVIELINNLTVETYERMGITENTDCSDFPADYFPLFSDLLETLQSKSKEEMDALLTQLEGAQYVVSQCKKQKKTKNPAAPFITSSLQQEASRKMNFTARRTMRIAQQLYEG